MSRGAEKAEGATTVGSDLEDTVAGAPTSSRKMMSEPILERVAKGQAVEPARGTAADKIRDAEIGRS